MDPNALKSLMPMLAGMGIPHMVASLEKMQKLMGGAPQGQKSAGQPKQGVNPGQPQAPQPGAPSISGPAAMDPQRLKALIAILQARGGAG